MATAKDALISTSPVAGTTGSKSAKNEETVLMNDGGYYENVKVMGNVLTIAAEEYGEAKSFASNSSIQEANLKNNNSSSALPNYENVQQSWRITSPKKTSTSISKSVMTN